MWTKGCLNPVAGIICGGFFSHSCSVVANWILSALLCIALLWHIGSNSLKAVVYNLLLAELSRNVRIHLEEFSSSSVETSCNCLQLAKLLISPSSAFRYAAAASHDIICHWSICNLNKEIFFTDKELAEMYPLEHGADGGAKADR